VEELVTAAGTRIAHLHCDAVQAVGKVPVDFHGLGVSTLSLSAHKFHGPRGIGVLLVRRGVRLKPQLLGGHQQNGIRPGTEPVVLAVGLARALELACAELRQRHTQVARLRESFLQLLSAQAGPVVVNGRAEHSLPHILNVSFPGCPADILLMKLDLAGVACSTGSACSSGSLLPSPVLRAMGLPDALLRSALRFSFSHLTTMEEVHEAGRRIVAAVAELRHLQLGSLDSPPALF
jgi:cysteine desulfurase